MRVTRSMKMFTACSLIGCLILLVNLSPVSGLCSTCLEERCYENGECISGCVPGFVGEYCNEACPSSCLNKACHVHIVSGAITCTDGCEPGYCDIKCGESCPGDCVTCDRQCGSCNVILCPERRHGAGCSEICSPRYEKCDRETGECIRCSRGHYGNECTRECTGCFTPADNILDTCLSGCEICQSEETCPVGFYGDSCELRCSTGCKNPRGCNRATRECSNGCVSGYHGLTCNYTCSERCLSGRCDSATGECSAGCVSGYYGLTCNYTCNSFCEGGLCNQHDGVCTSGCIRGYKSNLEMCEKCDDEVLVRLGKTSITSKASNEGLVASVVVIVCLLTVLVPGVVFVYRRGVIKKPRCSLKQKKNQNGKKESFQVEAKSPSFI